jgi:hypothetical protein
MKMEGRSGIVILVVIAVVGISGIIEALPHASESVSDLAIDAGILAFVVAICLVLSRLFGNRSRAK